MLHVDTHRPNEFRQQYPRSVETCVVKTQDLATLIRAKKLGSGKWGRFVLEV